MDRKEYTFTVPAPFGTPCPYFGNYIKVEATDDVDAQALLNSILAVEYNKKHGFGAFAPAEAR